MAPQLIRRTSTNSSLRSRSRKSRYDSWSSCEMMGSIPQSPSSARMQMSREVYRDTGFPEPFCGERNTTLAHPDAVTGPNACISAEDVAVSKVLNRSRRSFLGSSKHKRTITHGRIVPGAMEHMVSNVSELFEIGEVLSPVLTSATPTADPAGRRHSKDSYEDHSSVSSTGGHHHANDGDEVSTPRPQTSQGAAAPSSPTPSSSSSSRRRSVLHRLRWHK